MEKVLEHNTDTGDGEGGESTTLTQPVEKVVRAQFWQLVKKIVRAQH